MLLLIDGDPAGTVKGKFLFVITALVLAAIVFAPAMGYTIYSQGRTNYTINSEKVNYTIGSGKPAHETVYSEEMAEHYPTYSISSTPMPYSIKLGARTRYSIKPGINATNIVVLGGYKSSVYGSSERVGNGLIIPSEPENANEQAIGHPAPAEQPPASNVIDLTKPENVANTANAIIPANATNMTAPALAVVKFSIMGKVTDNSQTGLAGWNINLEQPEKTVIANTTTSEDGSYSFKGLMPGDYVVNEVNTCGYAVSPSDGMASVALKDKDITVDFINKKIIEQRKILGSGHGPCANVIVRSGSENAWIYLDGMNESKKTTAEIQVCVPGIHTFELEKDNQKCCNEIEIKNLRSLIIDFNTKNCEYKIAEE